MQQSNYILQLAAPSLQQLVQQQLHQNPFLEAMCEDEEEIEVELSYITWPVVSKQCGF
ncbi:MAG TPA: hypothetical protein H9906_07195 [Candidatus Paenalcaligenes intestinipullorum]|uniref:Uncharacterized protein n=1 Tax=Candidatus Paenalcaligenes intestinipullorum TaxID=2838718 RepID=A0A9D2RI02_9BURK|nr:hypothetical protein [Candidatus Paenalcaligenes intestinipullorum]